MMLSADGLLDLAGFFVVLVLATATVLVALPLLWPQRHK